jgi:hypothetical protein
VHRDQKIGLALGVLLIGAVAAFFFRNERPNSAQAPLVGDVVELDAAIAEKAFRPYLGESASGTARLSARTVNDTLIIPPLSDPWGPDAAPGNTSAPGSNAPSTVQSPVARTPVMDSSDDIPAIPWPADVLEFDRQNVAIGAEDGAGRPANNRLDDRNELGFEPIPARRGEGASNALPNERFSDERYRPREQVVGVDSSEAVKVVTHVVKRGETLSSLSSKYLGRESRFLEIYEANRDQLRDANDLRAGMTLRIPVSKSPRNVASPPRVSSGEQDSGGLPSSTEKRMFVPFRPRPADAASWGPSTEKPETAPKRLSQLPPDEAVIR